MKKGFTLVELLAVIVILAIILVIAVPGISGLIQSSTKSALANNVKLVLTAVNYKILEDDTFDPSTINESNINSILGLDDSNFQTITIKKINGVIYATIVGKNKWAGLTASGTTTDSAVEDIVTSWSNGANRPILATGMTPIKWNGSAWVDTTESDSTWYNYDTTNKQWANARTADGSMWVWIPRFIYKIPTANWHTITAGTISIQFSKGVDDNWNKSVIGAIDVGETANSSNNKWTNHPAFTFGNKELTGFWVAKFEPTAVEGVLSSPTVCNAGDNVTTKTIKVIPNAIAWRCVQISNMFNSTRSMEVNSIYGWGTSGNGIDTHMMKNIEWGAVAYLSRSAYGVNNPIWVNPSDNYTTGCAGDTATSAETTGCLNTYNTINGLKASTTGTIYGIYDMSSGSCEYIMGNYNNLVGSSGLTPSSVNNKYIDRYGAPNYGYNDVTLGDAVYETSNNVYLTEPNSGGKTNAWESGFSWMPHPAGPWYQRGGCGGGTNNGVFHIGNSTGGARPYYSWRIIVAVGSDL